MRGRTSPSGDWVFLRIINSWLIHWHCDATSDSKPCFTVIFNFNYSISWYQDVKIMPVFVFWCFDRFHPCPVGISWILKSGLSIENPNEKSGLQKCLLSVFLGLWWVWTLGSRYSIGILNWILNQICQSPRNASWLFMQGDSITYLYSTGGLLVTLKKKAYED